MHPHVCRDGVQHTNCLTIISRYSGLPVHCEGTRHRLTIVKLDSEADEACLLHLGFKPQDVQKSSADQRLQGDVLSLVGILSASTTSHIEHFSGSSFGGSEARRDCPQDRLNLP